MKKMKKAKFLFISALLMSVVYVTTSCEQQQSNPVQRYFALELTERSKTVNWDGKEHTPYTVKVKDGAPTDYQIGDFNYTCNGVTTANPPKDEGAYAVQVTVSFPSREDLSFTLSDNFNITSGKWPGALTYKNSSLIYSDDGTYKINAYNPMDDGITDEETYIQYVVNGQTYNNTLIKDVSFSAGDKKNLTIKLTNRHYLPQTFSQDIRNAILIRPKTWPETITYQPTVHEFSNEGKYKFDAYDPTVDGMSDDTEVYYKLAIDDTYYDSVDFINETLVPCGQYQMSVVLVNKNYTNGYKAYPVTGGYQIAALSWPEKISYTKNSLQYDFYDHYEINPFDASSFYGETKVQYKIKDKTFDTNVIEGLGLDPKETLNFDIILTNPYYEGEQRSYTIQEGLTISSLKWPETITYNPTSLIEPVYNTIGDYGIDPYYPLIEDGIAPDTKVQYQIDGGEISDTPKFTNLELNAGTHTASIILTSNKYESDTKQYDFSFNIRKANWPIKYNYEGVPTPYVVDGDYSIEPFSLVNNGIDKNNTTIKYIINGKTYEQPHISDTEICVSTYEVKVELTNDVNYVVNKQTLSFPNAFSVIKSSVEPTFSISQNAYVGVCDDTLNDRPEIFAKDGDVTIPSNEYDVSQLKVYKREVEGWVETSKITFTNEYAQYCFAGIVTFKNYEDVILVTGQHPELIFNVTANQYRFNISWENCIHEWATDRTNFEFDRERTENIFLEEYRWRGSFWGKERVFDEEHPERNFKKCPPRNRDLVYYSYKVESEYMEHSYFTLFDITITPKVQENIEFIIQSFLP